LLLLAQDGDFGFADDASYPGGRLRRERQVVGRARAVMDGPALGLGAVGVHLEALEPVARLLPDRAQGAHVFDEDLASFTRMAMVFSTVRRSGRRPIGLVISSLSAHKGGIR
jgi:hypothetical protein